MSITEQWEWFFLHIPVLLHICLLIIGLNQLNLTITVHVCIRKGNSEELMLSSPIATDYDGFYFRPNLAWCSGVSISTFCVAWSCPKDQPLVWIPTPHLGAGFGVHLVNTWGRASAVVSSRGNLFHLCQHCVADQTNALEDRTIWGFTPKTHCCFEPKSNLMRHNVN